ncbi:hypothetical protein ACET3X_007203 [Alternaria dauci]|uniref:Uncharacterized protein n=1 Tax=Alternaria dauci TaxID=48095 RepID=A0ABR3UGQ2_9PLEO
MATSVSDEPARHPVKRALAPWKLTAEVYMLFLTLKELPKDVHDELEGEKGGWDDEEKGRFKGGLGTVVVVRYKDTPVGPYDELLIVPGNFTVPQPTSTTSSHPHIKIPKKAQRISRIYVSQRTTTYNGRLNWNIPKHLARFSFSSPPTAAGASPPSSLTVQVFPPGTKEGDGGAPFFACTLKPWTWVPAMPLNTKYLPLSMAAAQPPVPAASGYESALGEVLAGGEVDEYDLDPKKEAAVLSRFGRMWTSIVLPITILVITMLSLAPYDIRWTAKLLHRDVRVLQTKLTTKLKRKFKPSDAARCISVPESLQNTDQPPHHFSEGTVYSSSPEDVSGHDSETSSEKCHDTLYELLESRLRATYASRNRDVSHEDRWRFRGSWLLLYKAIQTCPSNDSYDVLCPCAHDADEQKLMLEMMRLRTNWNRSPPYVISKMPAAPYTQDARDHSRYDSLVSNTTALTPTPPPAQIWLSILEATNDAEKIAPMAAEISRHVMSEKESVGIIEQIGDPSKKFSDADDTELRAQLRWLLCSEFMPSTPCC